VRETTNENERREDRRRRRERREGNKREREMCLSLHGKNSKTAVADEGLQRDRGNWSQTQYDN